MMQDNQRSIVNDLIFQLLFSIILIVVKRISKKYLSSWRVSMKCIIYYCSTPINQISTSLFYITQLFIKLLLTTQVSIYHTDFFRSTLHHAKFSDNSLFNTTFIRVHILVYLARLCTLK